MLNFCHSRNEFTDEFSDLNLIIFCDRHRQRLGFGISPLCSEQLTLFYYNIVDTRDVDVDFWAYKCKSWKFWDPDFWDLHPEMYAETTVEYQCFLIATFFGKKIIMYGTVHRLSFSNIKMVKE